MKYSIPLLLTLTLASCLPAAPADAVGADIEACILEFTSPYGLPFLRICLNEAAEITSTSIIEDKIEATIQELDIEETTRIAKVLELPLPTLLQPPLYPLESSHVESLLKDSPLAKWQSVAVQSLKEMIFERLKAYL